MTNGSYFLSDFVVAARHIDDHTTYFDFHVFIRIYT